MSHRSDWPHPQSDPPNPTVTISLRQRLPGWTLAAGLLSLALALPAFAGRARWMASETVLPSPDEWATFHELMRRDGWDGVQIARLPVRYEIEAGGVRPVGDRPAALRADLTGDGEAEWVVGAYLPTRPSEAPRQGPFAARDRALSAPSERARLAVFQSVQGHWKLVWRSAGLGYKFSPNAYVLKEVEQKVERIEGLLPPFGVADIDGDGAKEIVYQTWGRSSTEGGLPGIFRWDSARWVEVAPPGDRFSLRDLDGDHRLEVITASQFVGQNSGEDDVPRVWRWNAGRYQDASSMFPEYYRDLLERYRSHVTELRRIGAPVDEEAWKRALTKAGSLAG